MKKYVILAEIVFLIFIYFASQLPIRDYDIWFHIKSGEVFVTQGLTNRDVFSYTASGREWIHFEWLFQVAAYFVSKIGLWIFPFLMSIFVIISIFFLLRICDYIFGLALLPRLVLVFIFFASTYEYNTARPHVIAYMFLIITIFLMLARIFRGKKWYYITPFLTLIWTNLHSTGFLSWSIISSMACILFLQWLFVRDAKKITLIRELLIVAGINFLVTISPPMGLSDYKLLLTFFLKRQLLGNFISEWVPTIEGDNPLGIIIYFAFTIISIGSLLLASLKQRRLTANLWALPFILMILMGYTAARNVYLGYLGIMILFSASLPYLLRKKTILSICLGIFLVIAFGKILWEKHLLYATERRYYPVQATEFAKRYLNGNMFNDYTYGGYILYQVYPRLKVFIDGRADVYLCCEVPDYMEFATNKLLPDDAYRLFLNRFWDKYKIDFAIIATQKHNVMRRIAKLLNTDPHWSLVFWDDDAQVFVRHNGKNDGMIKQLDTKAATPYLRDPFPKDKINQAMLEYERMDKIAQSAHTSNAIGFILLEQGEYTKAKERFIQAIDLDPTFESPYMNLAELAAKDGDLDTALLLYNKARGLAPDRGLIYIRLGQLTLQKNADKDKTKQIWTNGLKNTVDDDAKTKLKALLSTLN